MKNKALTTFMATAITAAIVLPGTTASAAVSELSAKNSQYNVVQTTAPVATTKTTVPSGETSLTISNVSDSTVSSSSGQFTISKSLKPIFNSENRQALLRARATVEVKNGQITAIKSLTLNKSGTSKKAVVFDGGNATISGNLTAAADYLKIKDVTIDKELIVTNRVKKAITIDNVEIDNAITLKPSLNKKPSWVKISLKDIKTPEINVLRNKTTLVSDKLISVINVTDTVSLLEVDADVGKLVIDVDKNFDLRGEGKIEQAIVKGGSNVYLDSSHHINKVQVDDKNANVTYTIVDKTALNALISSIQYVPVSINGSNISYSEKWTTQAERTAFETAVNSAQAVARDTRATQEQVKNAITQLNNAIAIYKAAQKSYGGDKYTLSTLINSIQYVTVSSNNGYDVSSNTPWTTYEDKYALERAVSSAQKVVDYYNASQYEITNAINNLNNAISIYKSAQKYGYYGNGYYVDKSSLTSLIQNITYVPTYSYGNGSPWTSQESRNAIDSAVSYAQSVVDEYYATQDQVASAINYLSNAINTYYNARLYY